MRCLILLIPKKTPF